MDSPPDNLVLFDGVCNLCHASVQFMLRHDRRERFRFASIQSETGRKLLQAHKFDPDAASSFVLLTGGRVLLRSEAALEIARQFGGAWRLLGVFRFVPRSWRDGVYSRVARNRYRWFGRRESCLMPNDRLRERFLA